MSPKTEMEGCTLRLPSKGVFILWITTGEVVVDLFQSGTHHCLSLRRHWVSSDLNVADEEIPLRRALQ
jgi:hypothetical protein